MVKNLTRITCVALAFAFVAALATDSFALTISGTVTNDDNAAIQGVVMAGLGTPAPVTDASGNYTSTTVPNGWSGTVTPTNPGPGMQFVPASRTYVAIAANQTGQNYTRLPLTVVVYVETGGKVVLEGENWAFTYHRSNNDGSGNANNRRGWFNNSTDNNTNRHPRTGQGTWDAQAFSNGGPSKGDFVFSGVWNNTEDNNRANDGTVGPPNQEGLAAYLIKFQTPGRYFFYQRQLMQRGNNSNTTHFQWDYEPFNDNGMGVIRLGVNDNDPNILTWQWRFGRDASNGVTAVYVPRAGTYWMCLYHNETEACFDQIVLKQSATIPVLPAATFKDVESTSIPINIFSPLPVAIPFANSQTPIWSRISRTLGSSSYAPGGAAVTAILQATVDPSAAALLITTETLPVGWIAQNAVERGTGQGKVPGTITGVGTNQIVWTTTTRAGAFRPYLTYDAVPGAAGVSCGVARFMGVYNGIPIVAAPSPGISDKLIQNQRAGDGWMNAPESWDSDLDINPVPGITPLGTRWFACDQRYEIQGAGADIWSLTDAFHFVGKYVTGDCAIEAVIGLDRPPKLNNEWAKAGVMIRDSYSPGAPFMNAIVRRDGQFSFQWRDQPFSGCGSSDGAVQINRLNTSIWVKLTKTGATTIVGGYDTLEGERNTAFVIHDVPGMKGPVVIGLCVTSHDRGNQARGQFYNVATTGTAVGADRTVTGVYRDVPTTYTAGQIADTSVTLIAAPYGAGGLMITTETLPTGCTLIPNSIVATTGTSVTLGNRIVWTINTLTTTETLRYRLRIPASALRSNYQFTQSFYWNGIDVDYIYGLSNRFNGLPNQQNNWMSDWRNGYDPSWLYYLTIVGSGFNPTGNKLMGMTDDGLAASPIALVRADFGPPATPQYAQYYRGDNAYVLTGADGDIWNPSDASGVFTYLRLTGDFDCSATVDYLMARADWSKAGLMVRANLTNGSANSNILLRAQGGEDGSNMIRGQNRWSQGGNSDDTGSPTDQGNNGPARLRIRRVGTVVYLGFDNLEGTVNWAWKASNQVNIPADCYVGLFCVGNGTIAAQAIFTNVAFRGTPVAPMGTGTRSFVSPWSNTFATSATVGLPVVVRIAIPHVATGTTVTVCEQYPTFCTVSNMSGNGVVTAPGTIQWKITPWAATGVTTVTYQLTPQWSGNYMPLPFFGAYCQEGMPPLVSRSTITDSALPQAGTLAFRQQGVAAYAGTSDTLVAAGFIDNNMGGNDYLEEGHTGTRLVDHRKILIAFDMTGIGVPSASVDLAQLCLWYDRSNPTTVPAHNIRTQRILKSWSEGAGTGLNGRAALAGEVTWRSVVHLLNPAWDIPGLMQTTDVGPFNDPGTTFGAVKQMWVQMNVTNDVKDMIDTPANNFGWKVSQDKLRGPFADNNAQNPYTAQSGVFDFPSSENTDAAHRPVLLLLDSSRFDPASMVVTGTRSFDAATSYTWGKPLKVRLTIPLVGAVPQATITENLPTSPCVVSNISSGGTRVGNTVVWNIVQYSQAMPLTYELTVLWSQIYHPTLGDYRPLWFEGSTADMSGVQVTFTNSMIPHDLTAVFQQGVLPDPGYAGTADAYVLTQWPNNNTGGCNRLEEGTYDGGLGDHRKILIRFDVSEATLTTTYPLELGAGAVVVKATVLLRATAERRGSYHFAHRMRAWQLLKTWGEGTASTWPDGGASVAGEVDWTAAINGTTAWQTGGVMGVQDVGTSEPEMAWNAQYPQWVAFDVTKTTKDWITTRSLNLGWKIGQDKLRGVADNTPGNEYVVGRYDFVSRDATDVLPIYRPMLVIRPSVAVPVEISRFMLY